MTVNEGQTAILKCTADGHPPPKVTWSKMNSSLPAGRHVMGHSSALIIKNVKPEDSGVYSCSAKYLLGSANASAPIQVQCEFHHFFPRKILPSHVRAKRQSIEFHRLLEVTKNKVEYFSPLAPIIALKVNTSKKLIDILEQ